MQKIVKIKPKFPSYNLNKTGSLEVDLHRSNQAFKA